MNESYVHSGRLVRRVRRRCGLTQHQLALRAGTSQAAISRIERGVESPTVNRLCELLAVMGTELSMSTRPLQMWATAGDVAAERALTAQQRLEQGVQLAEFATELAAAPAASAADDRPVHGE